MIIHGNVILTRLIIVNDIAAIPATNTMLLLKSKLSSGNGSKNRTKRNIPKLILRNSPRAAFSSATN